MKCPDCGKEIDDNKLLCEYCGEEVRFVPLFDTELENQIDETISNMIRNINSESEKETEEDILSDTNSEEKEKINQNLAIAILGALIAFILVWFIASKIYNFSTASSFSYQYDKAIDYEEKGEYELAIKYMEHALAIDSQNLDARYELGVLYLKFGQYQGGIKVLEELLDLNIEDSWRIYDSLLSAKLENNDYNGLAKLLNECPYEDLINEFMDYSAFTPEFNYEGGVYNDKFELVISNKNKKGIIYYTLDGSNPTTNSLVYNNSLQIESGDYIVKAMFVNLFGCKSSIDTKTYYVSLALPNDPEVVYDTGIYTEPTLIEVYHDKSTKIYYSLDGSIPDEKSIRYTEPFEMPYGTSNLAFISIDENGLSSHVVRRTYQLLVDTKISSDIVTQLVVNNLVVKKYILDVEGHVKNKDGINGYLIRTIINQEGNDYYIVDEYYYDTLGNVTKTNNSYAVNGTDGSVYKAIKVAEGKYNLKNL